MFQYQNAYVRNYNLRIYTETTVMKLKKFDLFKNNYQIFDIILLLNVRENLRKTFFIYFMY